MNSVYKKETNHYLKVYEVDGDFWVSDSISKLKFNYQQLTGEIADDDMIREVDLDNEGMYQDFLDFPETNLLFKYLFDTIGKGENRFSITIDGEECHFAKIEGVYGILTSYRTILEHIISYSNPYVLSSINY